MSTTSINAYDNPDRANAYHQKKGFDPARKERMLEVALRLLQDLSSQGGQLLELGAGTGDFTKRIISLGPFSKLFITDGAEAMLDINRQENAGPHHAFSLLDFSKSDWANDYPERFDAVASSVAIHHLEHKQPFFEQVFEVLKPGGAFVFADHMAGSSSVTQRLISLERARAKLEVSASAEELEQFILADEAAQAKEGNCCESVEAYLQMLKDARFGDVECLWREFWLAVFVAKKPV